MRCVLKFVLMLLLVTLGATAVPRVVLAQEITCTADVVVQSGDTLSSIAGRFYGNAQAYNCIFDATNARANSDPSYAKLANVNVISVGWKLCIPGPIDAPSNTQSEQAAQPVAVVTAPAPTPTLIPAPIQPDLELPLEEMHPLMIEFIRQQAYPGSEITIEQRLDPGVNYSRYVASYHSEGHKIFALLTVPNGITPVTGWPTIVFNHGYIPPEIYRTTERYVAYQDAFARNGYITFKSDYRGHGFSEGESASGSGSSAYTIDVLNALASLKAYPGVDPDRIGMWGHSMGGSITLRAMVVSNDIKVGVIWAGTVGTMEQLFERWERRARERPPSPERARRGRWRQELLETYGTLEENPEFWASISPNTYVADLSGPILLQHATGDATVPVVFSQMLDKQIQAVGGDVEYIEYQGDNHNISANLTSALSSAVAYFDRYLK
ncbi:alpha/beta fold hydrolase [Chloroflexi bacterium TSY]|nr:alpha/beta fold hydrolase [Chloroflexi bacterium TSY]